MKQPVKETTLQYGRVTVTVVEMSTPEERRQRLEEAVKKFYLDVEKEKAKNAS